MTQEDDKLYIQDYKQKVREQYAKAQQDNSQIELDKADNMYNNLISLNEDYYKNYGERLNVYL